MEAYRDQYATIFNNGNGVVVLAISKDADTTLASWAREEKFPMTFVSDTGGVIGKTYGNYAGGKYYSGRLIVVVAPNGRISYRTPNFNVMSADAYTQLGEEVKKTVK